MALRLGEENKRNTLFLLVLFIHDVFCFILSSLEAKNFISKMVYLVANGCGQRLINRASKGSFLSHSKGKEFSVHVSQGKNYE